LKTWN
jgi:hypothetical protein